MSFRIHSTPVVIAPVTAHPTFLSAPAFTVPAAPIQPVVTPVVKVDAPVAEAAPADAAQETFKLRRKPNAK